MKSGKSYIEMMLSVWGAWAVARESNAVGYANESPMFREDVSAGTFGPRMPRGIGNREIFIIEAEVVRLPAVQRLSVVVFYQKGGSVRSVSARMGVRRDALTGWLDKAHRTIQAEINRQMTEARGGSVRDR